MNDVFFKLDGIGLIMSISKFLARRMASWSLMIVRLRSHPPVSIYSQVKVSSHLHAMIY
jgi:hypothetical protein